MKRKIILMMMESIYENSQYLNYIIKSVREDVQTFSC